MMTKRTAHTTCVMLNRMSLLVKYLGGDLGGRDGSRIFSKAAAEVTDSRSSISEFQLATKEVFPLGSICKLLQRRHGASVDKESENSRRQVL